jgi:hypothetical protein
MKNRYIHYFSLLLLLLVVVTSCDDFLDKMPDNRTVIDSPEKVYNLLVNAYPKANAALCAELSSDNVDLLGLENPNYTRFQEQVYKWETIREKDNADTETLWEECTKAIGHANVALQAIEQLGNPPSLRGARGEALLCRAYAHFMVVTSFCKPYNKQTSNTDLGFPYIENVTDELSPVYPRGTVAIDYEKMERDIEEGLPLIDDSKYTVLKYHFNKRAAYTFASRFYLHYQKWDKVVKYASEALGTDPTSLMRDYDALQAIPSDPPNNIAKAYLASNVNANFLLQLDGSSLGVIFNAYTAGSKYNMGAHLADTEVFNNAPWGAVTYGGYTYYNFYNYNMWFATGSNFDKVFVPRVSYEFEFTDPVAQIGYQHALSVALSVEEALLNRAESNIMQEQYADALKDMNFWASSVVNSSYGDIPLTEASIEEWARSFEYYTPDAPTPIKRLHPDFVEFPIVSKAKDMSKREAFLHCLLYIRRAEFANTGMRWQDIRRYGIEIYRRTFTGRTLVSVDDSLKVGDARRTFQIPQSVITAGVTPNPDK